MRKQMIVALALALTPAAAWAQPNFAGEWVRDNQQSKLDPYPLYWLTRGVEPGGGGGNQPPVIAIQQDRRSMQVTSVNQPLRSYVLDGRAHVRPSDTGMAQTSVTATMGRDALVVTSSEPFSGLPGAVDMNVRETWSLSPDGSTLTITRVRSTPAADQTYNEVYRRR